VLTASSSPPKPTFAQLAHRGGIGSVLSGQRADGAAVSAISAVLAPVAGVAIGDFYATQSANLAENIKRYSPPADSSNYCLPMQAAKLAMIPKYNSAWVPSESTTFAYGLFSQLPVCIV